MGDFGRELEELEDEMVEQMDEIEDVAEEGQELHYELVLNNTDKQKDEYAREELNEEGNRCQVTPYFTRLRNQIIAPIRDIYNQETLDFFVLKETIGQDFYWGIFLTSYSDICTGMQPSDFLVAIKFTDANQQNPVFLDLSRRAIKNDKFDHPNIVGLSRASFTFRGKFYIVFPFMSLGSLRSITSSRFTGGLPEDCVVIALKEAIKGLAFIHQSGELHKLINSGQIFLSEKPEIKISFSASTTVYDGVDQNESASSSSCLPVGDICRWAAAPEVYNSENTQTYTSKADVWSIGITALELAYGGLHVSDRKELLSLLEKMHHEKKLPEKRDFSKEFQKMVIHCLAMEPADRPTAHELLNSEIITKEENKDVLYFLTNFESDIAKSFCICYLYLSNTMLCGAYSGLFELTAEDNEIRKGVSPVESGDLPAFQDAVTMGYVIGSDTISVTRGILSRIETPSFVHGLTELVGLQVFNFQFSLHLYF
ncbi:hypothetical protein BUALT_Bualt07G0044900 [Buddleja alternifolia]|uniref:Protein kinase domain-containing protein n=1 Tax=Buddleja alternifolia TaxID=168488 RepID=A0AAV6XEU7_9LAMI|nr:hypothetical protein BUALT_Bualt07G0044900 [Buddleja alternifolia]